MFDEIGVQVREGLSHRQGPVLVGLSGGPDSLALFHILHQQRVPIAIAHLDHGMRPTAYADYQFVEQLAQQYGVAFYGHRVQINKLAARTGQSAEEAGREARYDFLFSVAEQIKAAAVAVGHTADDQVETVVMHLLRGAGSAGLSGMQAFSQPNPWSTEIPLIRPLLGLWRVDTQAYCRENGLAPIVDESNLDLRYTRNRLRHRLIPELQTYNPNVKEAIRRTATVLQAEAELLQPVYDQAWAAAVEHESKQDVAFHREQFLGQPVAVRRHLIKRALEKLSARPRDIYFDWVEGANQFSQASPGTGSIEIGAGIMLYKNKNLLWFYRQDNRADLGGFTLLEAGEVFDLPVPGTVTAAAGWSLQADFVRPDDPLWPIDLKPPDHWQCWLHVPAGTDRLQVRGRQPGDRFCPLGMGGHTVKVADLMTSSQVPEPIRDRWPLVIVGQEIAWIPGQAISHLFRVEKKIPPILFLKLTRKAAGRGTPID